MSKSIFLRTGLLLASFFFTFHGSFAATNDQIITFSPGWNTFSTPKVLDSITFQSGGTGLYFYTLTSTGWQGITPTTNNIRPLDGFVVNNTNTSTSQIELIYKENLSPMDMIFQKSLHAGWNLLGITTILSPFSSIGAGSMSVDFTRTSGGGQNFVNKIATSFYTTSGNNLSAFSLGESYGLFLQSAALYGSVQNQTTSSGYIPEMVSVSLSGSIVTSGKAAQTILQVRVTAGDQDVILSGFTLTRSGSTGFLSHLTNVRLYRNGVSVGNIVASNDSIIVSGIDTYTIDANTTQVYELKADTLLNIDNTSLGFFIQNANMQATEVATDASSNIYILEPNGININFAPIAVNFSRLSTGDSTVVPGSNNVKLFYGKFESSTPLTVKELIITPIITGSGIDAFVNESLSIKVNGSEVEVLTTLSGGVPQSKIVSFASEPGTPAIITIEGSPRNNQSSTGSFAFEIRLADVRDANNNQISLGGSGQLLGDKSTLRVAQVEVKSATVTAPSTSRLYSSASQEVARFAVTSRNETTRVHKVVFNATTTGSGITVQAIANSTFSIKLYNVDTNAEVSATATISGNTITFDSMNDTIATDTTRNYKVVLDTTYIENYYGGTVTLNSPVVSAVRDSNSTAVGVTGTATTKLYTLGTIPPTVLVTAVNENVFKVKVTNPDPNTGIILTSARFDLKTALPGNTTYTATACLRDLGNTNTCGGLGTSTATGAVPALAQTIAVTGLTTNMMADKNNGVVEFEVYVTSANLLPTGGQLQIGLTQLNYNVGTGSDYDIYVGTTGASATFTK